VVPWNFSAVFNSLDTSKRVGARNLATATLTLAGRMKEQVEQTSIIPEKGEYKDEGA
jgi:hypothetical protein